METFLFGKSAQDIPILGYRFGQSPRRILVLGGVHGNEPEGVHCSLGLIQHMHQGYSLNLETHIVPMFNMDGVLKQERRNSRGVDLNRNLPTKDWSAVVAEEKYHPGLSANSEPENQALVRWIDEFKPRYILSLHSWKPCININGRCQPEAELLHKLTQYEIKEDIGYPTPGCLGTYCGLERDIPTITYEIERGLDVASILKTHVRAMSETLKSIDARI